MKGAHLATTAVVLLLSACSSGHEAPRDVAERIPASAALTRAQEALVERDSGRFTSSTYVEGTRMTLETGVYKLSAGRFAVERQMQAPDGQSYAMSFRVVDHRGYLQMRDWPSAMKGCWLGYTDATLGEVVEGASIEGSPVPVSLLGMATRAEWAGNGEDALTVKVPVIAALQFLGVSARHYTKIRGVDDVLAPATIELHGNAVSLIDLRGTDVAEALEHSGAELDPRLLEGVPMMRTESRPVASVAAEISAPPSELVVSADARGPAATCH